MTGQLDVSAQKKEAARRAVVSAIDALQAPSASTFGSDSEIVPLTEANRRSALQSLLIAIAHLIPDNHPDVPLRAEVEKWINRT